MPAVLALLSSLAWGTADFLGGTLSRRRQAIAVVGGSQVFGLAAMILAVTLTHRLTTDVHVVMFGVGAGLFGLVGLISFYQALSTGSMGIVSPIASMSVVIPVVIGLVQGERPQPVESVGIAVAILGLVLACGPELSGAVNVRPVILAGVAAVTFGFCVSLMAQGGQRNILMTVTVMRISQVSVLVIVALMARSIGGLVRTDVPMLAAIGVTDAGANVLFVAAASAGYLSITSVLGSLFPVVTVLLAWWVHKERLQRIQYLGVAITVVGIVCISL